MGHGIAFTFALGGYTVMLNDVKEEILQDAMNRIKSALEMFCAEGMVTPDEANHATERIVTTTDLVPLSAIDSYSPDIQGSFL